MDDYKPAWPPDHTRIVFVRTGAAGSDIWVMRRDGTGARRLAGGSSRAYDGDPAWSPDGKLIAFTSTRAWPRGDGGTELYVMRADGTGVRRLTRTKRWRYDVTPSFSPDGRYLVYASGHEPQFALFRIRVADGRGLKRLTPTVYGDDSMPDWSPDGKRIAFVSNDDGPWAVVTIAANGGDRRILKSEPTGSVALPRWADSGAWVLDGFAPREAGELTLKVVDGDGTAGFEIARGFDGDW